MIHRSEDIWNQIRSGLQGGSYSTYGYVGSNPLSFVDPFGLTQCDIDTAYQTARLLNRDLTFGAGAPKVDLARDSGFDGNSQLINQGTFKNIPGRDGYIHLNVKYLDQLTDAEAIDLLDTIIHEALHNTRPPELQVPPDNDHAYIVPQAAMRIAADKAKYLKKRASTCGCQKNGS